MCVYIPLIQNFKFTLLVHVTYQTTNKIKKKEEKEVEEELVSGVHLSSTFLLPSAGNPSVSWYRGKEQLNKIAVKEATVREENW